MANLNYIKNILSNTSDYRVFHHIIEEAPQLCITGHKVRHFTLLFNIMDHTILKIGTSYCKKHGLLKNHIKNDLLITVLREFIDSEFFNFSIEHILSNHILKLLKSIIDKKIEYFQNIDLSTDVIEYYDYRLPIEHLKRDILEIRGEYFTEDKFPEFSGEYYSIVERIDDLLDYRNDMEINNTEFIDIENTLTNIQNEIFELLHGELHQSSMNMSVEREEINEYFSDKEEEINIEQELLIEESIKDEITRETVLDKDDIRLQEEYEIFEEKYINSKIEEYYDEEEMEEIIKNILREISEEMVAEETVTEETVTEETITEETVTEETVTEETITEETITEETVTEETITEETITEETVTEEIQNKNTLIVESPNISQTISKQKTDILELNKRLHILREGINEFKIEFAVFQNELSHFKKDMEKQNNRNRVFFLKHNIPCIENEVENSVENSVEFLAD